METSEYANMVNLSAWPLHWKVENCAYVNMVPLNALPLLYNVEKKVIKAIS